MIKVLEVPLQLDLSEFAAFLWQHRIPHRILEQDDSQQLWVAPGISPQRIQQLFEMWQEGTDLSQLEVRHNRRLQAGFSLDLHSIPLTVSLVMISLLASLLIGFGENLAVLRYLTITDLISRGDSIYTTGLLTTLTGFEWWRLWSPMLLHFNLPHLLFNLLWIWVVAARIERLQGRWVLLSLVLFSGLASNLAQYTVSGPLFGGLSGVVFAVLAYTWLWDRQRSVPERFHFPPALMVLMVVWLVLGYSGVLEEMGMGAVANTAHLIGLLAGLAWVPLIALIRRR